MESGGSPEEIILPTSEGNLARGSEQDGASQDEQRQPISLQQQIEALNAHIEESIERKFQSGKDRRISHLEGEIKGLTRALEKLKGSKGTASSQPVPIAGEALNQPHRASHLIQPSGGGVPAPNLRVEYEHRLGALRPGDVAGLMEVKREFRKRGLEVY
jgi:hypothetical protein